MGDEDDYTKQLLDQLAEAQDLAGLGVWEWDVRTNTVAWSRKLYEIYGLDPDTFGASFEGYLERVHPDDCERVKATVLQALEARDPMLVDERIVRPTGEIRYLTSVGRVEVDARGEPVCMKGTCMDVTDRVLLARRTAELEAANRDLEAFAATVTHDLRQPLRACAGFADILLDEYLEQLDPNVRDYLQRILASSRRMHEIVDGLEVLTRIARAEPRREHIDLAELAREIETSLRAGDPGRAVRFSIPQSLPAVADPKLMHIALSNLLGNAWKFTRDRAEAIIEVGRQEDAYYVRDNGRGFDPAYADQLFVQFRRLHGDIEGTGIGLTTVRRIVEHHGGRVWAEGEEGNGAAFYFTLPPERTHADE
jgi:signal transduction histidine kinase